MNLDQQITELTAKYQALSEICDRLDATLAAAAVSPAVAMGRMKSERKSAAARANGAKGGRPKKHR